LRRRQRGVAVERSGRAVENGSGACERDMSGGNVFGRMWRGEVPLHRAFWTWAVIGGIAVNGSTTIAMLILLVLGRPVEAVVVGYAVPTPYNVLVTVGVWRAAGRYGGDRRWADFVRAATVVGMTILTLI
jgi:hypothetical protein